MSSGIINLTILVAIVALLICVSIYLKNANHHNDTVERLAVPQIKNQVQAYLSEQWGKKYMIDEITLPPA